MKTLLSTLLLSASLGLTACNGSAILSSSTLASAKEPTMTQPLDYWTATPFCTGRYQIQLPANVKAGTPQFNYDGRSLGIIPNLEYGLKIIHDVRKRGKDGTELYITDRTLIPGKAFFYITRNDFEWDDKIHVAKYGMPYYSTLYIEIGGTAYSFSSQSEITSINGKPPADIAKAEQQEIEDWVKFYKDWLGGLTERKDSEIPKGEGVCLNGGFIPDDGKKNFFGQAAVRLNDYPDAYMRIVTGQPFDPAAGPLTKRTQLSNNSVMGKLFARAKVKTIRSGNRTVNGIAGQEVLSSLFDNAYFFVWESDGMNIRIELESGMHDANKAGSAISLEQTLVAWDAILPSFKKRP